MTFRKKHNKTKSNNGNGNIFVTFIKKKDIDRTSRGEAFNQKEQVNTAIDSKIDKIFDLFQGIGNQCSRAAENIVKKLQSSNLTRTLIRQEEKSSSFMCSVINRLDRGNEAISQMTADSMIILNNRLNMAREAAEYNKKKLLTGFGVCVVVGAVFMLTLGSFTAYEYAYNGNILGVVKNQEDVYKTVDIIGDKLSKAFNAQITIDKDKDITFKKIYAFNIEHDDKEDILNRLTYMKDMRATGYGIFVNEQLISILDSEATAKAVLEEMKSRYVNDTQDVEYKRVGFAEHVTIDEVGTKLGNIQKKEDVMEFMLTGSVEKKIHVVESGETLSHIGKLYGMKQKDLLASNPGLNPDKLAIGDEISLTQAAPVATIQTIEIASYIMPVEYDITYENTSSLYEGENTVKSKGSQGERQVVAEITRNNGIETARNEISSTLITEPVAQIVLTGTKKRPALVGTGKFIYPVRGRLSSRYGTRWGRMHNGIDLAASKGTKIVAADGGKVIFSGYNGSLGYMIKIDHGGGKVSLYGHCSKLFVKKGEKVFQGQHIANVGNTGRSTGPHLHFEIHDNGNTKNPLNYL